MTGFSAPAQSFGRLDPASTAALLAAASDLALVIDREGIICDLAVGSDDLSSDLAGHRSWIGRPWVDTVTVESRPKIEALLKEAAAGRSSRGRQINYPSPQRADVPILCSAVRASEEGRIVAFGRNLQPVSVLQRRLVEAQQVLERDYARLRHVESRYRLLFRISTEPVLIVDAAGSRIVEANPAAFELFGSDTAQLADRPLARIFESDSAERIRDLLATVRAAGRADDVRARLEGRTDDLLVSAHLFRQEGSPCFLVRLTRIAPDSALGTIPKMTWKLLKLVDKAPDGFVVTDADGQILSANAAFLDMAQLPDGFHALQERLDRWLGRAGVDLDILIANLRERGAVRLFASTLQGDLGGDLAVEVSAAAVMNGERQCFGFVIRNVARRVKLDPRVGPELPKSVEHLTELVGRISLKELVREATDVIERLSIEAALQLTGNNRAAAADMLGVSRQSLYVKMRRYSLAEGSGDEASDDHQG